MGEVERSCGSCSLCCKLLSIEGLEDRPGWTWCKHCRPGKGGCSIYDNRPDACRNFVCGWLSGALDCVLDPQRWHPAKARMMLTAEAVAAEVHVVIHVDANFPDRWREPPYGEDIRRLAASIPTSQRLFVRIKYRLIEIREGGELDHGEVPMAGWTDIKNASLADSFQRTAGSFERKHATTK
ncbi:MAG TPA: YkgJ family cysteine cluster protein [Xanthobacteraceae bacterium]